MDPQRESLPSLPAGCAELRRTTSADSNQLLDAHLDDIPGLNRAAQSTLESVAISDRNTDPPAGLGVPDLLRRRPDGSHALHPRVLQALPPDAVDPALSAVANLVEERVRYAAYQYPEYLLEARDGARDGALCPSAYHINVLDAARDLRANNLLTSVRPPGRSPPARSTLEEVVARMEEHGDPVEGVATLLVQTEADATESPVATVHGREVGLGRRSVDDIRGLCDTVRGRFFAEFSVQTATGDHCSGD